MNIDLNYKKYKVKRKERNKATMYYLDGTLYDGKFTDKRYIWRGNFEYDDGSIVAVYTTIFKVIPLLVIPLSVMILLCIILITSNKDTYETIIDEGFITTKNLKTSSKTEEVIVMKYNKYCSLTNGQIDVNIVNGNKEATVWVSGTGVSSDKLVIKKDDYLSTMEVSISDKAEIINATLNCAYKDKTVTYPIVIEDKIENQIDTNKDVTFEDEEVITE